MLSVCVSYMKSLSVYDICNDSCFVLTSNHLYVSICYGYRRLDLKGGSPAGGILDSSCLYANILEWKVGSFCHSRFLTFWCRCQNSKAGWRSWHWCVQGLRILVYKQHSLSSWSGIYFILVVCHFLKYLSEYISLLVTFSTEKLFSEMADLSSAESAGAVVDRQRISGCNRGAGWCHMAGTSGALFPCSWWCHMAGTSVALFPGSWWCYMSGTWGSLFLGSGWG